MDEHNDDRKRLLQESRINDILRKYKMTDMLTVYKSEYIPKHSHCVIFSTLIPNDKISESLKEIEWDMKIYEGRPAIIEYYSKDYRECKYLRFGNDMGLEPIVVIRNFYDIIDGYPEISQEFILYHNLHFIPSEKTFAEGKYIKFDECGNEILIATVSYKHVQIRVKEIRDFLTAKCMHLCIQYDCDEKSYYTLDELGLQEVEEEIINNDFSIHKKITNLDFIEYKSLSRIIGKVLLPPLDKSLCELIEHDFYKKKFVEFIIDIDEHGNEILHTSNPEKLNDNFGKNPESPHYLTPIFFRKEVLKKYYDTPSIYTIEDSYIRCAGLWGLHIDNHHDNIVIAHLGDLGSNLPYQEQLHWRQYNIAPTGKFSETYFKRNVMAEFTPSKRLEDIFIIKYNELQKASKEYLGWNILLPLQESDSHLIKTIHVPLTNEQKEFDELILAMTKIIIDSINVKMIKESLKEKSKEDAKSIDILEYYFKKHSVKGYEEHITFLRKLQGIRSTGSAHRKGSNYKKALKAMSLDEKDNKSAFAEIIVKSISFFEFIIDALKSECIK